ncbi:MAG TPA: hypothetical protein VGQ00_01855 [Candidatus Norongarragalinales archaeon]|jgi:hypothetical protein|nr:hypothetical protein [Candidatus Norongarragalinales archaeon]
MDMKKIIIFAVVIVAVLAAVIWFFSSQPGKYDAFAQCLTDKGVKMYGAFWCPHCIEQKEMFGSSSKYINYVECSLPDKSDQTQVCKDAQIVSYPTWEFANGQRTTGARTLQELAFRSGCQLPS